MSFVLYFVVAVLNFQQNLASAFLFAFARTLPYHIDTKRKFKSIFATGMNIQLRAISWFIH